MIKEKDLLTEEEILKFDEEIELIPLTFDFVYKGCFLQKLHLLKKFLLATLDTEVDLDKDSTIILLNNELPKENNKEYSKTIDIFIRLEINL